MISKETMVDLLSLTASEDNQPSSASNTPDLLADSDAGAANDTDSSDTELSDSPHDANPNLSKRKANEDSLDDYLKSCEAQLDHKIPASVAISSPRFEDREVLSARIIDKVRDYQQELFERARDENVIAV